MSSAEEGPQMSKAAPMLHAEAAALTARGFGGEILSPRDPGYDERRSVFNAMIDRRPALIARCTVPRDVAAAIDLARETDMPLSVFGGGHSIPGHSVCDAGVMIDLRPMRRIEVDPVARTCRAEAGVTWCELDAATQEHGLAVTGGRMSTTGIAGLTLGGGSGWLERTCGYTADNLLSVEIVTADGDMLSASRTENPQLFWGIRGGGGNFGVVTSFEFRLHSIGPIVLGGMLVYPAEMAAGLLRNFRDAMATASDEVCAGVALITAPHMDPIPEPVRGRPIVGVLLCYAGPIRDGEEALRPLREFGPPTMDMVAPMLYTAFQQLLDPTLPEGMRHYMTSDFLSGLPDAAIEILCRFHRSMPSPLNQIVLLPGGGAIARVSEDSAAFGRHRRAPFNYLVDAMSPDASDDEANISWARELASALKQFATGSAYLNFIGDEGEDRVVAAFGSNPYARLQALKDRYDPGNLFRLNQNIKPSGAVLLALADRASE
jgi:FAD/FMN-containing dehydrogenase